MQNYGIFFIPPKVEKQIVDKWSKDNREVLFDQVHQHVFDIVSIN
jgi:hypothetical protein